MDLPDAIPGDGVALTAVGTVSLRAVFDEILANPQVAGNANDLPTANQHGPGVYQIEFANVHNQPYQSGSGGIVPPMPGNEMSVRLSSQLPTIAFGLTFAINGSTSRRVTITREIEAVVGEPPAPPMTPFRFLKVAANGTLLTYGVKFVGAYNIGDQGGAIMNEGTLEVVNSEFRQNSADDGGAIYNEGELIVSGGLGVAGEPPGVRSLFIENLAQNQGGAIKSDAGGHAAVISDTEFVFNTAGPTLQMGVGFGGGVAFNAGTMNITGSSFFGNRAGSGGGLYSWVVGVQPNPVLVIDSSVFDHNFADIGHGGGLFLDTTNVSFTNCSFFSNSASKAGGAIMMVKADLTFTTCSFAGNSATATVEAYDVAQLGPSGPGAGTIHADEATEFYHCWIDDLN